MTIPSHLRKFWAEQDAIDRDNARRYADHLRAEAKAKSKPTPHCCGASGFNPMLGDICPACEERSERSAA